MHELSIAHEVVATVIRHLPRDNRAPVRWIRLSVGVLNHVANDALRLCFEATSRGTPLEGAKLNIDETLGDELRVVDFELDDQRYP